MTGLSESERYESALLAASYATGRSSSGDAVSEAELVAAAAFANQARLLKPFVDGLMANGIDLPPAVVELFSRYRNRTLRLNGRAMKTLARVLPALRDHDLRFVVFKGPIQQVLLTGDPLDRPAADIDVLIDRKDFEKATQVLFSLGYELLPECHNEWWISHLGEQHLVSVDGSLTPVDLHHRTQQPGSPAPRQPEWFLEEAVTSDIAGLDVPTLSRSGMLLLCVISIAKGVAHRESVAAHVLDLGRIVRGISAEEMEAHRQLAARQGLAAALTFALTAVASLFGDPPPHGSQIIPHRQLLPLLFAKEGDEAAWPRRASLLWSLTDGRILGRSAAFGWELFRSARSEASRRRHYPASAAAAQTN